MSPALESYIAKFVYLADDGDTAAITNEVLTCLLEDFYTFPRDRERNRRLITSLCQLECTK